jgi:phosphoribosylamine--glycine ligase
METVGVLVVSYGAREAAMVDALARSQKYKVELYIADKQLNPFNVKHATKHIVVPSLNVQDISKFVQTYKDKLDFVIVGSEKPIIDGLRDIIEAETGIPVVCPKKDYAIEESKVKQRLLFQEIAPEANPRFKIFDPKDYQQDKAKVKVDVYKWLDELNNQAVVKPDKPAAGKGVGVWGDHFVSREELFEHFMSNFQYSAVIIEEKVDGEESSCMAFCDGKHFIPLPDTRDYKRAFDDDKGPNTGGMGSYKDVDDRLPFLTAIERENEIVLANRVFDGWSSQIGDVTALRGVPLYLAFMHTGRGIKILEINSRPGDPESINLFPIIKDDFVDVCYKMIEGNLLSVELNKVATVLTYKVPPDYGGYMDVFPGRVTMSDVDTPVDFMEAYKLAEKYGGDKMRIYPGSMELRNNKNYALKSRAVGVLGIGDSLEEARGISQEGARAISGGGLWNRTDIAAQHHIAKSIEHMEELRKKA